MNKRNFYNQQDAGKVFLWALLLPQLMSLVFALVFASIYKTPEQMQQSIFYVFVACTLAQICFAFVLFYYNKKNKINFKIATEFNPNISLKNGILCAVISIVAVFGFVNFIGVFDNLFAWLGINTASVSVPNNTFGWFLFNVIFLAIIPAVLEEFIFRGIIFNGLKKHGFWYASLISALMFALVHLSVQQFVFPIIMGIVFAMVLKKTGSLMCSIIVHLCNNFIVVLISYISNFTGRQIASFDTSTVWGIILAIVIAVVAAVSIWLIIKYLLKPCKNDVNLVEQSEEKDVAGQSVEQESVELNQVDEQKELTNNVKNRQNGYVIVALLAGVILWLIVVIGGVIA